MDIYFCVQYTLPTPAIIKERIIQLYSAEAITMEME